MLTNKKRNISILMIILMLISLFMPPSLKAADNNFIIKKAVLIKYTGNEKTVRIPKGVKKIGAKAFYGNIGIEKVIMPSTVKTIGKEAFSNCRNLQGIKLPKGIKKVENKAFENCSSLEKIIIPESVKSIGSKAFANCKNLTDLTVKSSKTKVKGDSFKGCKKIGNMNLDLTDSAENTVNENTEKKIADNHNDNAKKKEEIKEKKPDTEKPANSGNSGFGGGVGGGFGGGSSGGANEPKKTEKLIKSVEKIPDISLTEGSKKEEVNAKLPKLFTATLSDETKVKITIKSWKGLEKIDFNKPARYEIEAEYDFPSGVTGAKKEVKTTVEIKKKQIKTIVSVEADIKEITVEYGADWKKIEENQLPKTLSATLSDNTKLTINGVKWSYCNTYKAGKTSTTAIYNLPDGVVGEMPTCTIAVNIKPQAVLKPKLEFENKTYYYKDNPVITVKNMPKDVKTIKVEAAKGFETSKEISSPKQYTVAGDKITLITDGIFESTVKNFDKNIELDVKVTINEERVPGTITIQYAPDPNFNLAKKRVVKIITQIPEITVEVGTGWINKVKELVTDGKLPASFTVELSDNSTRDIAIKSWGFVGTRTATTPGVPRQSEAEFDLLEDIEKEDTSGKKVKFYANITVVPKQLPMLLKTNKTEYYYEEKPEITIENWQSHNNDIKISRIKDNVETCLDETAYEFNAGKIVIFTDKVFSGEVAGDEFSQDTELVLSVTVGTNKLPNLTIKYLKGKKNKPNMENAKFTATAIESEDGTTQDGFVIFQYAEGKNIKILLTGKDGVVLNRDDVLDKLKITGRYNNSSDGAEFSVNKHGAQLLKKWNSPVLELRIPSDYNGIKVNKKFYLTIEIEGLGASEVKIITMP